jgi:hypothetical protein
VLSFDGGKRMLVLPLVELDPGQTTDLRTIFRVMEDLQRSREWKSHTRMDGSLIYHRS